MKRCIFIESGISCGLPVASPAYGSTLVYDSTRKNIITTGNDSQSFNIHTGLNSYRRTVGSLGTSTFARFAYVPSKNCIYAFTGQLSIGKYDLASCALTTYSIASTADRGGLADIVYAPETNKLIITQTGVSTSKHG